MFKKNLLILISLITLTGCQTPPEETVVAFEDQKPLVKEDYNIDNSGTNTIDPLLEKKKTINIFDKRKKITLQTLEKPMGITFDKEGNFYLLDQVKNKIFKFNNNGDYLEEWGDKGIKPLEFKEPKYIITNKDGNLVITDTWNQRIQIIGTDGTSIDIIKGDFFGPKGITQYENSFFVADTGHHSIKVINDQGKTIKTIGKEETDGFTFNEPTGMTVDEKGNLYIVDSKNNRIIKLNKGLKLVKEWHIKGWEEKDQGKESWLIYHKNKLYLSDPISNTVRVYDTDGNESKPVAEKIDGTSGIAINNDTLYIVEFIGKQIKKVDLNKG